MESGNAINIFPDYFSNEVVHEIKCCGKQEEIEVYRVSKYGEMQLAFLNYYEEVIMGLKVLRVSEKEKRLKKYQNDIDSLSVSCYYLYKDVDYYYNVTLKRDYPGRTLLKGKTSRDYGLSQLTDIRKKRKKDSHVDWWLYSNATPWTVFNEVTSDE